MVMDARISSGVMMVIVLPMDIIGRVTDINAGRYLYAIPMIRAIVAFMDRRAIMVDAYAPPPIVVVP